MLWGRRWGDGTIVAGSNADGASHATAARRFEPVPHAPGARQHHRRCHRDEPSELARRRPCPRHRHPLKKLEPSEVELLRLFMRWHAEATQKGRTITRIAVAFEAGRDGFWLARWLRARGIEAYVIHPTSVAVSREHRRAKTDRLDTGLLKRVFIGWLR